MILMIYFCEYETRWEGFTPQRLEIHVYRVPIPTPQYRSNSILLVKREKNQHEKMIRRLEEKAVKKSLEQGSEGGIRFVYD